MSNNLETRPGKITVPGRPEVVDLSRVRGDIGHIEYEITGDKTYIDRLPQREDVMEAISRGERVFVTGNDDLMYVRQTMDTSDTSPVGQTILVPGRPVEVDLSQVNGDIRSGIRFEISPEDKWVDQMERGQDIQDTLGKGGRVFVTEDDDLLFVQPPLDPKSS